ncbi:MAG TPA: phosphoglycerate mutase, partial [Candidatus Saccharimonadia bacterium]|nr:phosphoglycerate mutase [Candidatus Saccharimonadia bacterium]
SDALVRELKPLFGDAGFELSAAAPDRWFLRGLVSEQVPAAPDPEDILGDDLEAHLPAGRDGAKWRRLLNEAQVTLHNHPVNIARVARGALAANTLWFWGGGRRPELSRSFKAVAGADRVLRALARGAGAALVSPGELGDAEVPALLDCWNAAQWQWFCAEGHALVTRRLGRSIDALELEAWSGERFRYRSSHRWRFWRKAA